MGLVYGEVDRLHTNSEEYYLPEHLPTESIAEKTTCEFRASLPSKAPFYNCYYKLEMVSEDELHSSASYSCVNCNLSSIDSEATL